MAKLKAVSIFIALLFIASCSKDDDIVLPDLPIGGLVGVFESYVPSNDGVGLYTFTTGNDCPFIILGDVDAFDATDELILTENYVEREFNATYIIVSRVKFGDITHSTYQQRTDFWYGVWNIYVCEELVLIDLREFADTLYLKVKN